MVFTKVQMGKDYIFKIEVFEPDGKRLEHWKVMKCDFVNTVRILFGKYGFNYSIKEKKDKDLDWAI